MEKGSFSKILKNFFPNPLNYIISISSPNLPVMASSLSDTIRKLQGLQEYLVTVIPEMKNYKCPKCQHALGDYKGTPESSDEDRSGECSTAKAGVNAGQEQGRKQEKTQNQCKKNSKKSIKEKSDDYLYVRVEEYNTLQRDCESLSKQVHTLSSKICELERLADEKENLMAKLRESIDGFKTLNENQKRELSEKDEEISDWNLSYEKVIKECKTLKQRVEHYVKEEKDIHAKITEMKRRTEQLDLENSNMNRKYENVQQEKSRLEENHRRQTKRKEEEISRLIVSIREKEETTKSLEKDKRKADDRCRFLEQEIVRMSRNEIAVGFHTTLAPTMSSLVLDGLTSRLTERLTMEKVDLVRQPYSGDPDYRWPLLVVCVNVSRIGADAKEALKGIPKGNNKDVALLVFHHKEAHALPSQTSDKILTGSEFSHLGTIIDFAFLSQKGIYECDMNTIGIQRVVSFLLQYKTQKK